MLLVDDRIGSRDYLSAIQAAGVPCELQRLDIGDFAFIGRGFEDRDLYIAVELKKIRRDLISSFFSSRFAGSQLIGLQTFDRAWLVTEGIYRSSVDGVMESLEYRDWQPVAIGNRRIMTSELESWILSQCIRGGLHYWHTPTKKDTARFIATLYHWWTSKSLEEHRSHQAIYLPPPDRVSLVEPPMFTKMASCLPNTGWDKAGKLHDACAGSVRRLCALSVADLQEIPGIGKTIAQRIFDSLGAASAAVSEGD